MLYLEYATAQLSLRLFYSHLFVEVKVAATGTKKASCKCGSDVVYVPCKRYHLQQGK
jgi:glycerol-3-phosphate O-acyltransferase